MRGPGPSLGNEQFEGGSWFVRRKFVMFLRRLPTRYRELKKGREGDKLKRKKQGRGKSKRI